MGQILEGKKKKKKDIDIILGDLFVVLAGYN